MEDQQFEPRHPLQWSQAQAYACDVLLVLLGGRYGSRLIPFPRLLGDRSVVDCEVQAARACRAVILAYDLDVSLWEPEYASGEKRGGPLDGDTDMAYFVNAPLLRQVLKPAKIARMEELFLAVWHDLDREKPAAKRRKIRYWWRRRREYRKMMHIIDEREKRRRLDEQKHSHRVAPE